MLRKFKIELEVYLEDSEFREGDITFIEFIYQELEYTKGNFKGFAIKDVQEI